MIPNVKQNTFCRIQNKIFLKGEDLVHSLIDGVAVPKSMVIGASR